jgi:spore maturation protein CgeB
MMEERQKPPYECGHPQYRRAMTDDQAALQAMAGMSHCLYTFWPQMVFFVSAFFTTAAQLQLIRERRHKIVMLHTESPYQDDEQMRRGQFADLNLLNDPSNIEAWKQLDGPVMYQPHSYDPEIHRPHANLLEKLADDGYESDFSFVGTMFTSRKEFFEKLREASGNFEGINVAMGGSGWSQDYMDGSPLLDYLGHPRDTSVDNKETARVYRNSKVGINFYRREGEDTHAGEGWAMGPREIEMAAAKLPFLRDPRGEGDEVLHMLPRYHSPEEAAEQLKWLLAHPNEREKMADEAFEAIRERTFLNHAKKLMGNLDKWGVFPA